MSKTITVQLEDKTIEVKKLPILRYAEMLKAVKELPKHLGGMDFKNMSMEVLFEKLPFLLGVAGPDIVNIVSIATELKKEEVEQLGLNEMTDIIIAIAEVNDYKSLFEKAKKVMARPEVQAALPANPPVTS